MDFYLKKFPCSSTAKIYADINIPETRQLKQKFDGIIPLVKLLVADKSQSIEPVANPTDIYMLRYRIVGKIVEVDIINGWFYESCPKCRIKLMPKNGKFTCDDDDTVTPEFVMQLNLIIQDETAKIEAVMFGRQAEKLVGLPLTKTVANHCLDKTKLPATAKDPTKSEVEQGMMGTDASEKERTKGNDIGVVSTDCNDSGKF
ncbi:Nucleic acid-binding protein [Corchorus capsularis]|uniref:Nucleic acid-binding protein n=1 Tax=Corchorus capsularis TaxID=210143 RepID=A0A1R3HSZ7_COCAP|nr:Nucleic acid-binding protein [Corchorus capsularis]